MERGTVAQSRSWWFGPALVAGALALALVCASAARAQQIFQLCVATTSASPTGQPFKSCIPVDSGAPLPVTGSFSATTTGFPGTTQTTGTPISVTTGGNTGTLPAGSVVVASNVGATNIAYCKLGASATTSDQPIQPGSWFGF